MAACLAVPSIAACSVTGSVSARSLPGPVSASSNRPVSGSFTSTSSICRPWSGAKAMPSSRSTAPPVYVEIHPRRDAQTSAGFLKRFLVHFPHRVHTILTDNGSEFTDRFAVDMKNKPPGRASGHHPFDLVCANHRIDHRLTRPYRPQTNGLVERFNRRISEAIGREPKRGIARRTFPCHADRDAFLNRFVADYNRTRLKCLG